MSHPDYAYELASVSDVGTEREHNEDAAGILSVSATCGLVAVADGVSGYEAGETASTIAIESVLAGFSEQKDGVPHGKRIYRAAQRANIDVYDKSIVVPELRGMATTLTAVVVERGELEAAHVGDSRLYLVRAGTIVQLSKDHTAVAERVRMGLMSEDKARKHPDRSILTRSLGRELIAAVDRITIPLQQGDVVVVCSDGLYNVLDDPEIAKIAGDADATTACKRLIDVANEIGTIDNVTAAVLRMTGPVPAKPPGGGLGAKLRRLVGGG